MTKLIWDEVGSRLYEQGIDRCVFYTNEATGVAWNGLISVKEAPNSSETTFIYVDGEKIISKITAGAFQATLEAFTYPDEFSDYDGTYGWVEQQRRGGFGLCYRTMIGSDLGPEAGYKLHLVYNALAMPTARDYSAVSEQVEPLIFSWEISTAPERIEGTKGVSHLVIDSRKAYPWVLAGLEDILYGSELQTSTMPSINQVLELFDEGSIFRIINHGDGTFTASGPDEDVFMLDDTSFQMSSPSIFMISDDTYEASSL